MHSRSVQFNIVTDFGCAHASCTLSQNYSTGTSTYRCHITLSRAHRHQYTWERSVGNGAGRSVTAAPASQGITCSRFNPANVAKTSHPFRNSAAIDKAFDGQCSERLRARSTCGARLDTECVCRRRPRCHLPAKSGSRPRPIASPRGYHIAPPIALTRIMRRSMPAIIIISCVKMHAVSGKFQTILIEFVLPSK